MRRPSDDFYRSAHFHPSDPFDLFRTFFAGHDPFHDPFMDPLDGFFSHHKKHHKHHPDIFFPPEQSFHSSNLHMSIFDDLPAGTTTCSTTFQTGDGGTVHITRTVIGGDGSVRREMRFRTPSTSRGHQEPEDGWSRHSSRMRRQHSQQCEAEGAGRSRQPRQSSRCPPQRERRGEPDGAAAGEVRSSRQQSHHHNHQHTQHTQHTQHSQHHQYPQPTQPQHQKQRRNVEQVDPEPNKGSQAGSRERHQRHRSQVTGARQRDPAAAVRRETRRRERSCEGSSLPLNTVYCPLCDGKFPA